MPNDQYLGTEREGHKNLLEYRTWGIELLLDIYRNEKILCFREIRCIFQMSISWKKYWVQVMYGSVLFLGIRDKWFTRLCPRCLLILDVATFIRCLYCLHRALRTRLLLPQLQRWEYNYKATPPVQDVHCFFQSFLFSFNHKSHKISSPLSIAPRCWVKC